MSLERLVSKYIGSTEHVLKNMETVENSIDVNGATIRKVVEYVKAYFNTLVSYLYIIQCSIE